MSSDSFQYDMYLSYILFGLLDLLKTKFQLKHLKGIFPFLSLTDLVVIPPWRCYSLKPLFSLEETDSLAKAERRLRVKVEAGGRQRPWQCQPRQRTAFIIPYRDRAAHLSVWLAHLHPVLARQQLDYQIFVVEQLDMVPFNRGALLNIGVLEAAKGGSHLKLLKKI